MKKEKLYIYGKHAVLEAISNHKRNIVEIFILEGQVDLEKKIFETLKKSQRKIKIKNVNKLFFDKTLSKKVKHQGILAISYKMSLENYNTFLN